MIFLLLLLEGGQGGEGTMTQKEQSVHIIDAQGQILGRLATKVAVILRGKDKSDFRPHLCHQSRVIVYNTDKMRFSGKKLIQKKYYSHSGYPGSLKEKSLRLLLEKDSTRVLRKAIWGMLPKNRLRAKFIKNLEIFKLVLPQKYAPKQ